EVEVGKTPFFRFDTNDYSVPPAYVRKTLVVLASPTELRVIDGSTEVTRHERSYDRGGGTEKPEHPAGPRLQNRRAPRGPAPGPRPFERSWAGWPSKAPTSATSPSSSCACSIVIRLATWTAPLPRLWPAARRILAPSGTCSTRGDASAARLPPSRATCVMNA